MDRARPHRRPDRPSDPFYYGYVGRRRVRLATTFAESKDMLLDAIVESRCKRAAAVGPGKAETVSPTVRLEKLTDEFRTHLLAELGVADVDSRHYVTKTITRLRLALDYMKALELGDLDRDALNKFLVALQSGKATGHACAPRTRDHYAEAMRRFGDWLIETGRVYKNPFGKIRKLVTRSNRDAKQTFVRRPFTVDELERLDYVTRNRWRNYADTHPRATAETIERYRRKGEERAMAYLVAAWTAPRHNALRHVRWSDLDLDGRTTRDPETGRPIPTMMLSATYAKNRSTSYVPIVPFLVDELREWRKTKAAWSGRPVRESDPVFELPVHLERKLREDAALAGIEARTDAVPPERIDFHCMRTTTATLCVEAGIAPKVAQQILQHKTIEQTLEVYARLRPEFLGRELEKLPVPHVGLARRDSS